MSKIRVTIGLGILAIFGGIAYFGDNSTSYVAPQAQNEPQVIEKEVEVSELQKRIETAQNAEMDALKTKAQAAYNASLQQGLKEIELEVRQAFRKELEAQEAQLEQDLSF